jgi:hypothetical protein
MPSTGAANHETPRKGPRETGMRRLEIAAIHAAAKKLNLVMAAVVLLCLGSVAQAAIVTVTTISSGSHVQDKIKWYQNGTGGGGAATIVSLSGLGGNLENSQPSPLVAAKLTTALADASKAEIGTFGDFGLASTVLNDLTLAYSYYRHNLTGGNTFAAPSIKLEIKASGFGSDRDGYLVYEPYWNGTVPSDVWQSVSIDSSTGAGTTATGGWWWDGGFGITSGAGGPPLRSLSEWVTAFQAADPTNFANAHIQALSVGVGTYNRGQVDYFDNISIRSASGNVDTVYKFGVDTVPEPATLLVWSLLGATSWLGMRVWRGGQRIGRRSWSPENRQAILDIVSRNMPR